MILHHVPVHTQTQINSPSAVIRVGTVNMGVNQHKKRPSSVAWPIWTSTAVDKRHGPIWPDQSRVKKARPVTGHTGRTQSDQ